MIVDDLLEINNKESIDTLFTILTKSYSYDSDYIAKQIWEFGKLPIIERLITETELRTSITFHDIANKKFSSKMISRLIQKGINSLKNNNNFFMTVEYSYLLEILSKSSEPIQSTQVLALLPKVANLSNDYTSNIEGIDSNISSLIQILDRTQFNSIDENNIVINWIESLLSDNIGNGKELRKILISLGKTPSNNIDQFLFACESSDMNLLQQYCQNIQSVIIECFKDPFAYTLEKDVIVDALIILDSIESNELLMKIIPYIYSENFNKIMTHFSKNINPILLDALILRVKEISYISDAKETEKWICEIYKNSPSLFTQEQINNILNFKPITEEERIGNFENGYIKNISYNYLEIKRLIKIN